MVTLTVSVRLVLYLEIWYCSFGACDDKSLFVCDKSAFLSGASDGEIRVWDLPSRKCLWSCYGHRGSVRGLVSTPSGDAFYSCSEDKTVKLWSLSSTGNKEKTEVHLHLFCRVCCIQLKLCLADNRLHIKRVLYVSFAINYIDARKLIEHSFFVQRNRSSSKEGYFCDKQL